MEQEIKSCKIDSNQDLYDNVSNVLGADGPVLCEVIVPKDMPVIPTQGFKENEDGTFSARPLEDMNPLLDRKQYRDLMIAKLWEN